MAFAVAALAVVVVPGIPAHGSAHFGRVIEPDLRDDACVATKRGSLRYRGYLVEISGEAAESCRIAVEVRGSLGWQKVTDLEPPPDVAFSWGYEPGGAGPVLTGGAVLADALGVPVGVSNQPDSHRRLARDFTEDVIAHRPRNEPWQLHRETVLWWVRGWYVGHREVRWPSALLKVGPTTGALTEPCGRDLDD